MESVSMSQLLIDQLSYGDYLLVSGLLAVAAYYFYPWNRDSRTDFDNSFIDVHYIEPVDSNESGDSLYDKMKQGDRNMVVFYGSQTGTSEEFANRIAKEATRFGLKAMTCDPEDINFDELVKISEIENSMAVFCLATYGEGDPTDNARGFYTWLQRGERQLNGLSYAVFGLGNRTYEHYNAVAIYADARIAELNGNRICELGLGDDDGMIEDDFMNWKELFWTEVCSKFDVSLTNETDCRQYKLVTHKNRDEFYDENGKPINMFTGEPFKIGSFERKTPPYTAKNPLKCQCVNYRELYKGDRSCLHVEFDLKGEMVGYKTGDHLVVLPENDPELVDMLGELLNIDLDEIISMECIDIHSARSSIIPSPCTFRTAFTHYVDIASTPRVQPLREMSAYVTDDEDKVLLNLLCSSSPEGKAKYNEFIKGNRNIVQIINDIKTFRPPADLLIEVLPRLQPRYYSISSSNLVNPDIASITAVVVDYKTPAGYHNKGVATYYLKRNTLLNTNSEPKMVPIFFVRSQFKLPTIKDNTLPPIIMIGPGTGLAPFRGFLQEIQHLRKTSNLQTSDVILYYGCRNKDQDYLYREELEGMESDGTISKLRVAFSRDQGEKVYVTHLLEQSRDETWDIIGNRKGYVYVCGDAKSMARNVLQIIKNIIMENLKTDTKGAETYFKTMEHEKRYKADVWS